MNTEPKLGGGLESSFGIDMAFFAISINHGFQ